MIDRLIRRVSGSFRAPLAADDAVIDLYRQRYEIAVTEERWDSALVFLDRILELRPKSMEIRALRAELIERSGDRSRAVDAYLRLLPWAEQENPEVGRRVREALDRLLTPAEAKAV